MPACLVKVVVVPSHCRCARSGTGAARRPLGGGPRRTPRTRRAIAQERRARARAQPGAILNSRLCSAAPNAEAAPRGRPARGDTTAPLERVTAQRAPSAAKPQVLPQSADTKPKAHNRFWGPPGHTRHRRPRRNFGGAPPLVPISRQWDGAPPGAAPASRKAPATLQAEPTSWPLLRPVAGPQKRFG